MVSPHRGTDCLLNPWFIYKMVTENTLRPCGLKQAIWSVKGIRLHQNQSSVLSLFSTSLHTCASFSESPSFAMPWSNQCFNCRREGEPVVSWMTSLSSCLEPECMTYLHSKPLNINKVCFSGTVLFSSSHKFNHFCDARRGLPAYVRLIGLCRRFGGGWKVSR